LANFSSVEGLKPVGDTMWAQTFETGEAIIGAPGSAQLGNITAGAVEESNVDLSEQLVNLIIAQRNYQANAKTIETANATTQTIINLR
jgi:flagellar hook protein FlgE